MSGKWNFPSEGRMIGWRPTVERETVLDLPTHPDDFPADSECPWCGSQIEDVCTCSLRWDNRTPLITGKKLGAARRYRIPKHPLSRVLNASKGNPK